MQPDSLIGRLGQVAMAGDGVSVSIEYGPTSQWKLLLWVEGGWARRLKHDDVFWMEWHMGQPLWLRFAYSGTMLNRLVFEAVEVLPADGPAQPPPGAVWFPSTSRCLRTSATP